MQRTTFDQTSSAVTTLASSMVSAVEDFLREVTPSARRPGRSPKRGDCGCRGEADPCSTCEPSSCDCVCCVGDVDLVVYTRLGETRVVPVEIHNPRRRERDVQIELSEFTTRGGRPAGVTAQVVGAGQVTIPPCATHELIIVTRAGLPDDPEADVLRREGDDRVPDVDDCVVAVADLRIAGCDTRPVRIAVAVLPRRCDAYEVSCQHECC